MNQIKGYKTIAFNVIMAVVAVAALGGDETPSAEEILLGLDSVESAIVAVWTVGGVLLRALTSSPIFRKG